MWGRGGSGRAARHRAYTWGMANNDQGYDPFEPGHSTPEFEQFARENQKYRKASHARGGASAQSARRLRVRARARLLRAVQGRGQRVLAMRTRAWPAPAAARLVRLLLREGAARRLPVARASTLRAAQTRRYRRRAPPAAAKRQVVRLPPCRRPPRARRGPHLRSRSSKHPSLSPCSLARTARLTMS